MWSVERVGCEEGSMGKHRGRCEWIFSFWEADVGTDEEG